MTPARLALRTVLCGRPRAWTALVSVALAVGALALACLHAQALAPATLRGVAAVALVVSACAVGSSAAVRAIARRHELATLRAFGMRRRTLVLLLELEALWITVIGALLGLGLASLAAWLFRQQGRPLLQEAELLPCASAAGALVAASLLAALVPALQAARHDVARGLALLHPDA